MAPRLPAPPSSRSQILSFDDFELDPEAQQLRKSGVLVRLQPQPFRVLFLLASRAGQVVSRDELRHEVWGDETFVDFEQGLNFCIRQIRVILGDEAQAPHYIETIPRRGYRFIGRLDGAKVSTQAEINGYKPSSFMRRLKVSLGLAGALITMVALGVAILGHSRGSPVLSKRDFLLVTDFENDTGDPVFDGTLRKAIAVDLGQSPYLNVVSDEKIRQTLGFMGKPHTTRITPDIGREICRRNGIKALLAGSIGLLGNQYVLTLEAQDANSGDTMAQEQAQASGKEQVLSALGKCSDKLRLKLGDAFASDRNFTKPLEQVTTSSLEALQLFSLGLEKRTHEGDLASIPLFQRAIQIDPNFALAYAHLGVAYSNIEQWPMAEEYQKKALALSDRVSERERLYITAHYYSGIGQKEKEIETYRLYSQLYPNDPLPQDDLAFNYDVLGRFDKALDHALVGLRLFPDSASMHSEAAHAYSGLGRLEEARAVANQGLANAPDSWSLQLDLSNIALAQADTAHRAHFDAAINENPEGRLNLLYRDAALAASHGRLREAEDVYSQAEEVARKLDLKDNIAYARALRAVYEAYLQHPALAKKSANSALGMSQMFDVIVTASWALAWSSDDHDAVELMTKLAKGRPEDIFVQSIWFPGVQAIVRLHHQDAGHALQLMNTAAQYDRANLDSMLLRATAYLQAKRTTEAVEEFRGIVALKTRFPYDPACSLAQLGLARAYLLAGDKAGSLDAYRKFFSLWKDADPDIPVLKAAEAEYASLQ